MEKPQLAPELKTLIDNFSPPEELGFGRTMAPVMIQSDFSEGKWSPMKFKAYGPLSIDPAAKVLHYAQEIFEGLKAYKNQKGEVTLFRPDMNAARFNESAKRLAMPSFSEEAFVDAAAVFSKAMSAHIPEGLNRSLYLRPFMIATEPTLGVRASDTYSFYLIGCLVESYFSRPNIRVLVEDENCRAAPGGVGFAKTGANYGASLLGFEKTKSAGLDQTLWLDAAQKKYVEELSGMNFFALVGKELVTPPLSDTILAGITRASILEMAAEFGLTPKERRIDIKELLEQIDSGECSEAFACGTASVIAPIESLTYKGKLHSLKHPEGKESPALKEKLLRLQRNLEPDKHNWVLKVD